MTFFVTALSYPTKAADTSARVLGSRRFEERRHIIELNTSLELWTPLIVTPLELVVNAEDKS